MSYGSVPPAVPPPEGKAPRKLHFGLIAGAVVVLFTLYLMGAFNHGSTQSTGTASGGAPDAPSARLVRVSGGNPILGQWTLLDTDEAAYCQSYQEFTAGSSTSVKGGKTSTGKPIYAVHETYVLVSYGGPNFETWDVKGPDDLTLKLISPYSVTACRYHRK